MQEFPSFLGVIHSPLYSPNGRQIACPVVGAVQGTVNESMPCGGEMGRWGSVGPDYGWSRRDNGINEDVAWIVHWGSGLPFLSVIPVFMVPLWLWPECTYCWRWFISRISDAHTHPLSHCYLSKIANNFKCSIFGAENVCMTEISVNVCSQCSVGNKTASNKSRLQAASHRLNKRWPRFRVNPFHAQFNSGITRFIFAFAFVSWHWDDAGNWNPFHPTWPIHCCWWHGDAMRQGIKNKEVAKFVPISGC